jgi:hypothetical protein
MLMTGGYLILVRSPNLNDKELHRNTPRSVGHMPPATFKEPEPDQNQVATRVSSLVVSHRDRVSLREA